MYIQQNSQHFLFKILTRTSVSYTALFKFNFLTSLRTVFLSTCWKEKFENPREKLLLILILGWLLYLGIALKVGYLDQLCGAFWST